MCKQSWTLPLALAGVACGWADLGAQATAEALAAEPTIVNRSPFLPPGFTPPDSGQPATAGAAGPAGGYEFRGVYQLGDAYRFLVSEPRSRNGAWVELGRTYDRYEVRSYDPATETLTLFYNNTENALKLARVEANPTPMPVSGQIQQAPGPVQAASAATPQPVRRTIRPPSRPGAPGGTQATPPPPAWLEKLRQEAATRRAQATQGLPSGIDDTAANLPSPPPPPTEKPPTPPPNISIEDLPPVPTTPPPEPPPEVLQQMQQSWSASGSGG